MYLYPAIDLYEAKAVRLYKGDYAQMTVYNENPVAVAEDFVKSGATHIHLVDLEGAKSGQTPNFETVCAIKKSAGVFCEIGGGIRSMDAVERYLEAGIDRVILGTAAVKDPAFLSSAVSAYGKHIAVGVDIKDGFVAISGWQEKSEQEAMAFCRKMQDMGVSALICTDISKDGAMQGTNHQLYRQLSRELSVDIIASGGVSAMEDVEKLSKLGIHGAIVGKAYYTGAIDLAAAIEVAK